MENLGEISPVCGNPDNYIALYLYVDANVIDDIKYVCLNDPANKVALEMLCGLVKGRTLDEVAEVKDGAFCELLGSEDQILREKGSILLQELNSKILEYKSR